MPHQHTFSVIAAADGSAHIGFVHFRNHRGTQHADCHGDAGDAQAKSTEKQVPQGAGNVLLKTGKVPRGEKPEDNSETPGDQDACEKRR